MRARRGSSYRIVEGESDLGEVVDALCRQPRFALDTEFHRERTYFPQIALVQIAWADELVLIDPLAVDVAPLARALESGATVVMHAATQDIEVLCHVCGTHPKEVFDTQIAAAFVGMSTPSLASLHQRFLGVKLPKGDRMTNWLERPLRRSQLDYAASDVERLLELTDILSEQVASRGRTRWVADECALLIERGCALREPGDAWRRIKEVRRLRGGALAAAQAIAAWREERAAQIDIPVRQVMSDMAVVSLAQVQPRDEQEMSTVRGFDPRSVKKSMRGDLCRLITEAAAGDPTELPDPTPQLDQLKPAASLLAAWLAQRGRELELDPAMLGTRTDVERLLGGVDGSRLADGWRRDLVGEAIEQLLSGHASIAFDGDSLSLEQRSGKPLVPDL